VDRSCRCRNASSLAAAALGISAVTARVRLMRSHALLQEAMTVAGFPSPKPHLVKEHSR